MDGQDPLTQNSIPQTGNCREATNNLFEMDGMEDGEYELENEWEETMQLPTVKEMGIVQSNEPTQSPIELPKLMGSNPVIETKRASSRKEKRALVAGEVASDGTTSKGRVQLLPGGVLEWNNNGDWIPAVYHDALRPQLIQQMDLLGTYDNPRARGIGQWDITSYHPDQKNWGPSRFKHWPHMPGKLLFRLECKNYPVPEYKPDIWFDRGRVVLDMDNNPIKMWANIPLTLASNADPWLLENIRREDRRITQKDLRARMPLRILDKKGKSKPLGTLSALGMQMTRFRMSAGCPAWTEREGSDTIRDYVKGLLSDEGLAANSTEELTGLSAWQQAECRKPNKGLYPERAGDRALSTNERKRRDEAESNRLQALRPQQEIEEQCKVKVVQPAKRKRDSRAPTAVPTTVSASSLSPLGNPNSVVQAIGQKRSHADIADPEAEEAVPLPKRRNLGAIPKLTNLPLENHVSRVSQRRSTSTPSTGRCRSVDSNQIRVPLDQGGELEGEEQKHKSSTPASQVGSTAIALLQSGIPNSFSLSRPATQRKRSRANFTDSDTEQGLPSPKRRNIQGNVGLGERPVQSLPTRYSGRLVPHLPRLIRASPRIREENEAWESSQQGSVDAGEPQSLDLESEEIIRQEFRNIGQEIPGIELEVPEMANGEKDYRYVIPKTRREIQMIAEALLLTRLEFHRKIGCEAPETPEGECYAIQHQIIQNATWGFWQLEGEPPVLWGLDSWTGGFGNWHRQNVLDPSSDTLFAISSSNIRS